MEALHERVSEFVHFPRENKLLFTEYVASLGNFMKT